MTLGASTGRLRSGPPGLILLGLAAGVIVTGFPNVTAVDCCLDRTSAISARRARLSPVSDVTCASGDLFMVYLLISIKISERLVIRVDSLAAGSFRPCMAYFLL